LVLHDANGAETKIVASVLGQKFTHERGAFAPELEAASADINGDGVADLVVVQKGLCSNHACDFHFLEKRKAGWKEVGVVESWAVPYVNPTQGSAADVVVFDHLSDDCDACSPPSPVLYRPNSDGRLVEVRPLGKRDGAFEPLWDWQLR